MTGDGASDELLETPAWVRIGESCARGVVAAIVVGSLEAAWMSRAAQGTPAGFGLVIAGLWFLPMLVLAIATSRFLSSLIRDRLQSTAIGVGYATVTAILAFVLASRTGVAPWIRVTPIELTVAVGVTFAIAALRVDGAVRRSIAVIGIVSAVVVQLFAARWIDTHRAYVTVIVEQSLIPKLALRALFSRVV